MIYAAKGLIHYSSPQFTFSESEPTAAKIISDKTTPPYVSKFPYCGKTINLPEYIVENCAPTSPGSCDEQHLDFAGIHNGLNI